MIGAFVISVEVMCWNDVMNVQISRLSSFLSAVLASLIITLNCFSALAAPVLSIRNAPAVAMNKSRVVLAHHVLSAAFLRATNVFGILQPTRWYRKFLTTIGAIRSDFLDTAFPSILGDIGKITGATAINRIIAFCGRKSLIAFGANMGESFCFLCLSIMRVLALNTTKYLASAKAVRLDRDYLSAVIASAFDHLVLKRCALAGNPVVV